MTLQTLFKTISLATPILMGSVDAGAPAPDAGTFKGYLKDLHITVSSQQWAELVDDFSTGTRTKLSLGTKAKPGCHRETYERRRAEFEKLKPTLKADWIRETRNTWPEGVDAHHVIPLGYNGLNRWWNIRPLDHVAHVKAHANARARGLFAYAQAE